MNTLRIASLLVVGVLTGLGAGGCVNQLANDSNRLTAYHEYRDEEYDAARERFERVLDDDPTDWRSHYYVGLIALHEDDEPETARRHLDIAYTVYQGRATKRLNYEIGDPKTGVPYPTRSDILDATAEAVYQQGHEQTLYAYLREAVENHGTANDYLRMGKYMRKVGDPDTARSAYRNATRLVGDKSAEPYLRLATFYEELGDQESALIELRKAYGIDPEHREIGGRLRSHGVTPGPTIALPHDYDADEDEAPPAEAAEGDEAEDDGEES